MPKNLQMLRDCQIPGCPKSNIWQSLMLLALVGMAVTLAISGAAEERFREVLYVIMGAIAFTKVNWNQGQIVEKADTAATVAVETKQVLTTKIESAKQEIVQKADDAKSVAADAVTVTLDTAKALDEKLEKVHKNTNGAKEAEVEAAYQRGLQEGKLSGGKR